MGSRFVLLLDADVVPSRGLREGFLRALRGEGPPLWGDGGGLQGVPKGLDPPHGFGVPSEHLERNALGVPNRVGSPKDVLGVPKGFHDPGVPSVLEVPKIPEDPNIPRDPNVPKDPSVLEVPSIPEDPNVLKDPSILKDPNVLKDPNILKDPSIPKAPNVLKDPNILEDPNVLKDPSILKDPNVLEVPSIPKDPNVLKDPSILKDPNVPMTPNVPMAPTAPGPPHPPWSRVLFVLPAFEVRSGWAVPGSKAELRRLWGAGHARPFYGALCPRCQAPTDYGRWWALPPGPRLRVAYEAPWRDPWEPFYVGPARGVPPFDERFLQYGFNRISQACELHVAGFRFAVLDGAFVVHGGFKEASGFHGARGEEQERNRRLFRRFRSELRLRYPGSPRRC